jgi:hypothetical protein
MSTESHGRRPALTGQNGRTAIETPIGPGAVGMELSNIRVCARCGLRYDWRKSPSTALKMTYCSSLCERADLGFTLEALLRVERGEKEPTAPVA